VAFATVTDVATRQGRTFTSTEQDQVTLLIELATAAIADAALKDDAWAAALTPVPDIIKGLTIELVGRAMANYEGLTSQSEQIGSYQYMKSFNKEATTAFALTNIERRIVRRTIGSLNYDVRTPTFTEDYLEGLLES
jgi:hypothetical protein